MAKGILDIAFDTLVGIVEKTPAAIGLTLSVVDAVADKGAQMVADITPSSDAFTLGGGTISVREQCATALEGVNLGGLNLGQSEAVQCGRENLGEMSLALASSAPQKTGQEFFLGA